MWRISKGGIGENLIGEYYQETKKFLGQHCKREDGKQDKILQFEYVQSIPQGRIPRLFAWRDAT